MYPTPKKKKIPRRKRRQAGNVDKQEEGRIKAEIFEGKKTGEWIDIWVDLINN